jgi:hypothetical protein
VLSALLIVAALSSALAEDRHAPRPLPPVSQQYPASLPPAVIRSESSVTIPVMYSEDADARSSNHLAPDAPPVEPIGREEPLYHQAPSYNQSTDHQLIRFVETVEQEDVAKEPSPFDDEPEKFVVPEAPKEPEEPAEPSAEPKKDGEPQTFGQKPVSNSLQFLRTEAVLLDPGAWQFDTGFAYTHFNEDLPVAEVDDMGTVVGVLQARIRDRLVYTPLAFRYGWSTNVQLFGVLPTGFSNTQISTIGASEAINSGGIGDLTAGASFHLLKSQEQLPDVIATLSCTAPTGDFNAPVFGVIPGTALGQGFWAFSAQLLFVNRYDPIIAFYGVGFRHLFEREFDDFLFSPGEQLNYQFGVGFAVNDRVTLSATFQGFYISNTLLDRTALEGTNVEPMSLRFAATIARNERIIEPFAQIGMTDSAPAASFGITVTFY